MLTKDSPTETLILANGEYPTHPTPVALLNQAAYVVCCDGAADAYILRGQIPDIIIGDGDSISAKNKKRFQHILHTSPDQETNDQTKAVNYCLENERKELVIVGATGKREDHTLGNISLLMDYMAAGANVQMATDYGVFTPACGDATFHCYPGEQVSIINFGASGLKGDGLVYPLSDFTNWWQGTLNEAVGNTLTIHAKGKYLIFRTY
ncbi:thiamine diphosphokinase [uncultured Bacteroides sp.]|uniref:thiamine diphosphokinase n=1 Tax=uncultured Bacteroides sp. TaxID=162156 RepID=UPI003749B73E